MAAEDVQFQPLVPTKPGGAVLRLLPLGLVYPVDGFVEPLASCCGSFLVLSFMPNYTAGQLVPSANPPLDAMLMARKSKPVLKAFILCDDIHERPGDQWDLGVPGSRSYG